MRNVEIVRNALVSKSKIPPKTFRSAIVELLSKRDLTVCDLVYSLNNGNFDEVLRRRVQRHVQHDDKIIVVAFEQFELCEVNRYSLADTGKLSIEIPKRASPRNSIKGMHELLTRILNEDLGLAYIDRGEDAIRDYKNLDFNEKCKHLVRITKLHYRNRVTELINVSVLTDDQRNAINVNRLINANATYVIRKHYKCSSFFDNIKSIYQ